MGEILDVAFAKVQKSLNHIGQKKPSLVVTTSVNQDLQVFKSRHIQLIISKNRVLNIV